MVTRTEPIADTVASGSANVGATTVGGVFVVAVASRYRLRAAFHFVARYEAGAGFVL